MASSAEGALATIAILGVVAVAGAIFQVAWAPIGVALLVAWICVFRTSRRIVFAACALVAVGVIAGVKWAARRARKKPYRATLYITGSDGRPVELGSGDVPGQWRRRSAVEGEAMRRYVEVYGYPVAGTLCCRAEPAA